mgnify:CR=1 FL=1
MSRNVYRWLRLGAVLLLLLGALVLALGVVADPEGEAPQALKPVEATQLAVLLAPEELLTPTPLEEMPQAPQPPAPLHLYLMPEKLLHEPWKRYAVPVPPANGRPRIVVVLDDLGLNRPATRRAIALPGPLTLSFMTYAEDLENLASAARAGGHELLLHVPMEPRDPSIDPGPRALTRDQPEEQLRENLLWGLGRMKGYVGINNHMGSGFTTDAAAMQIVLSELRLRGLLFLDSRTAGSTQGVAVAGELGVPVAARDIFLDHEISRPFIRRQLETTEALARQRGLAIAIGHPHAETLDLLAEWLPNLEERGFQLVPISAVVTAGGKSERPPMTAAGRQGVLE